MRVIVVSILLLALFASCVSGRGCFSLDGGEFADAHYECALQFFATGLRGKSVSLKFFEPAGVRTGEIRTRTSEEVFFNDEKAVIEFSARTQSIQSGACLNIQKIEAIFKAPYATLGIDKLVVDSFQGEDPPTQDPRGKCFRIQQRTNSGLSTYGIVYTDLWCALKLSKPPRPLRDPQQMNFEQLSSLQTGC